MITNKTPIDESVLSQTPKVQYVGVIATGYNVVDTQAASDREL